MNAYQNHDKLTLADPDRDGAWLTADAGAVVDLAVVR